MTERELQDHHEITRLLYLYARAIDSKDFALFDRIFTADAVIHYDVDGGTKLPVGQMKEWLAGALQMFRGTQHAISAPLIEVDGDAASSTCYLTATHEQLGEDGRTTVFVDHCVYSDRHARTEQGWRIAERTLNRLLMHGDFQMPDSVRKFVSPPTDAVRVR